MSSCDLYIDQIKQLVTVKGFSQQAARGASQQEIGLIEDGAVAIRQGVIIAAGRKKELERAGWKSGAGRYLNAGGMIALPGFIDPHTHLVFAGSREEEFVARLRGEDYLSILEQGGGILHTVRATRSASAEELFRAGKKWALRLSEMGTTTLEAKSGYGLDFVTELKQLKVIRELNQSLPLELVPTYLGAHAWPEEYQADHPGYLQFIIKRVLPEIARLKLAEFCDVFCEKGVFSRQASKLLLEEASKLGLKPKLHADEINNLEGAELAAEVGAVSADHLVAVSEKGLKAMAAAGVIAVLLPGTSFILQKGHYAPARRMIEAGVSVALASDFNPGSSPVGSMALIVSLAVIKMGLAVEEAITAVTINAAHALDRGERLGSIEPGKQADLILLELDDYRQIPYYFGFNTVKVVIKKGRLIKGG